MKYKEILKLLCPFCNSDDVKGKFYKDFDGTFSLSREKTYLVHFCNGCGLYFTNPKPRSEELKIFFEKEYNTVRWGTKQVNVNWNIILNLLKYNNIFTNFCAGIIRYIYRKKWVIPDILLSFDNKPSLLRRPNVLDVGCANGGLLATLTFLGYNAVGLEPSEDMVRILNKKGAKVYQGFAENFDIPKKFDIITCLGTLSSVNDIKKSIENLLVHLDDNGMMIIKESNPYCGEEKSLSGSYSFYGFSLDFMKNLEQYFPMHLYAIYGIDDASSSHLKIDENSIDKLKYYSKVAYIFKKLPLPHK